VAEPVGVVVVVAGVAVMVGVRDSVRLGEDVEVEPGSAGELEVADAAAAVVREGSGATVAVAGAVEVPAFVLAGPWVGVEVAVAVGGFVGTTVNVAGVVESSLDVLDEMAGPLRPSPGPAWLAWFPSADLPSAWLGGSSPVRAARMACAALGVSSALSPADRVSDDAAPGTAVSCTWGAVCAAPNSGPVMRVQAAITPHTSSRSTAARAGPRRAPRRWRISA